MFLLSTNFKHSPLYFHNTLSKNSHCIKTMSKFDPYHHLKASLNSEGSLTRHPTTTTAATNSSSGHHAVLTKDIALNTDKNTWLRIYLPAKLPSNDATVARLPIILYFHGGMSIADTPVNEHNNLIAAEVPSILVAVEFRLPAQYEDAAAAIEWVRSQAASQTGGLTSDSDGQTASQTGGLTSDNVGQAATQTGGLAASDNDDQWIRDYGDVSRFYLYGTCSGANMAFRAAMMEDLNTCPSLKIAGIVLSQPFFGGERRMGSEAEMAHDEHFPVAVQELLWDHRFSNPVLDGEIREKVKKIGRCLVLGFSGDPLIDRQRELVEMLVQEGVTVETHFDEGGFHEVDMVDSRRATMVLNLIKDFV